MSIDFDNIDEQLLEALDERDKQVDALFHDLRFTDKVEEAVELRLHALERQREQLREQLRGLRAEQEPSDVAQPSTPAERPEPEETPTPEQVSREEETEPVPEPEAEAASEQPTAQVPDIEPEVTEPPTWVSSGADSPDAKPAAEKQTDSSQWVQRFAGNFRQNIGATNLLGAVIAGLVGLWAYNVLVVNRLERVYWADYGLVQFGIFILVAAAAFEFLRGFAGNRRQGSVTEPRQAVYSSPD